MRSWANIKLRIARRVLALLATLWVVAAGAAPTIVQPPTNQWVLFGQPATISVVATGAPPFLYQWRREAVNLPGGTNAQLMFGSVQTNHAGRYSVVVTEAGGQSVTSALATLNVVMPVTIASNPQPRTVQPGATVVFSVGVAGSGPLRFQWKKDGLALAGATNQNLILNSVSAGSAGYYSVLVTNPLTSAESLPAQLTVAAPVTIAAPPSNQVVALGSTAVFSVAAIGEGPLSYQWYFNSSAIAGANGDTLVISPVQATHAGTYTVSVGSPYGSAQSASATLTTLAPAVILTQPSNQMVVTGGAATFSVTAAGDGPLGFQWKFNGLDIAGATNASLTVANVSTTAAGTYSVAVWNPFSGVESDPATLLVGNPVVFTAQPMSQVIARGDSVEFYVSATGLPRGFQWTFNGAPLPGETKSWLSLSNVQAAAAGSYAVTAWNDFGSAQSLPALLTVLEPVVITTPPLSQSAALGAAVSFSVAATGAGPLHYEWVFNGAVIPGATNQTLVLPAVTSGHAGSYAVRVWNTASTVLSLPAVLTVGSPPVILTQPVDLTVAAGGTAVLSVTATGGLGLTYRWVHNGAQIPGLAGPLLTLTNVHLSDAGDYRVTVADDNGAVESAVARLTVTPPALPFNDMFSDAALLSGVTYLAGTGSTVGATREGEEPLHDGKKSARTVWLSWTAPVSGLVKMSTMGSDFDTLLAVYTGTALPDLVRVASDDDISETNQASAVAFQAQAGVTYRIAVGGHLLAAGNIRLELELVPANSIPPTFLSHPQNRTVAPGGDADMIVDFSASETVQLQWMFLGATMANGNSISNALRGVTEEMVGRYRVKMTTPTNVLYSRWGELQINSRGLSNVMAQDKLGGALAYGQVLSAGVAAPATATANGKGAAKSGGSGSHGYTTTQIFSTVGAGSDPGEPMHCGLGGGHSQWYLYQAETNGTLRIDTEGSNFDTVLAVYIGPGDSYSTLTNVACDNNSGSNGLSSAVTFQATQGTMYWIAVDGVGSAVGTVHLHLNLGSPVSLTTQPADKTVLSGTNVAFTVSAAGMTNHTYQWRFGGTNISGATAATLNRTNVSAAHVGSYDVVVRNPINTVTSSVAALVVYSATINITNQPQDQFVNAGANVSFVVVASGAGVLRYQWRRNGTNLAGATNGTLTLNNVQATDAGVYAVSVSDNNGSRLSSNAVLTVQSAPVFTLHPASRTYGTGEVATLTAAATGVPAPAYQWWFNDAPLVGQTTATLVLNGFDAAAEGQYFVQASNAAGVATSQPAELFLNAPLRFANVVWSGGTFSARVIGVTNASYIVQCSTNTSTWSNVATNQSATGISAFTGAGTNASCFLFRAVAP